MIFSDRIPVVGNGIAGGHGQAGTVGHLAIRLFEANQIAVRAAPFVCRFQALWKKREHASSANWSANAARHICESRGRLRLCFQTKKGGFSAALFVLLVLQARSRKV
jgi:hypothetical protein